MASFTAVDETLVLFIPAAGESIDIALSGTYVMDIFLELEQGSLGSGSWQKIREVSGADDATIADVYTSRADGENIRLRVQKDTSGTCTATLTDNDDRDIHVLKDSVGNTLATFKQSGVVFPAEVTIEGEATLKDGLVSTAGNIVTTAANLTLTEALHAGKIVTVTGTTGRVMTLPEATGTGNVYKIFYVSTVSSGNQTVVAPSSATDFVGGVSLSTDIGGTNIICNSGDDTVTMDGTTDGGVAGSYLKFTDVVTGTYLIEGFLPCTGTEGDPFSAAV